MKQELFRVGGFYNILGIAVVILEIAGQKPAVVIAQAVQLREFAAPYGPRLGAAHEISIVIIRMIFDVFRFLLPQVILFIH